MYARAFSAKVSRALLSLSDWYVGGKIGCAKMEFWKMFEIDEIDDERMCSALMQEFLSQ